MTTATKEKKPTVPQEGFHFRDSDHSYFLNGKRMTGVTTILGVINKPALVGWAARMAVEYVETAVNSEAFTMKDMPTILTEAAKAHTKKKEAGATAGTDTHALVEDYIKNCIEHQRGMPILQSGTEYPIAIKPFVDWAHKENITFIASEERMYSETLFVAGTCDFVFEKEGKRYIGDVKTYKKLWDRVPMFQCAGYGIMWREMNGKEIDGYCVFNLPKERNFDESQDVRWSKDVAGDQEGFLAALSLYRVLANW